MSRESKPGIMHVLKLLDICHDWLGEMEEDLDEYQGHIVQVSKGEIVNIIANLEGAL